MAKRKQQEDKLAEGDESDSDRSLVDVDFEFFDPNADIDYLALKRLLTQLFSADAESFPLQDLADLILSQPLVGTTVKCDGRESDPYAFLTVLNLHVHKDRPSIKALISYILEKSSPDAVLHSKLQALIGPNGISSSEHVGFIFSERLINMPVQIMPHMYRMLADEIQWALDDNEPYDFTYFIIISRVYRLSAEEAAELQASSPRTKRQKQSEPPPAAGVYPFHPEDDYIRKFATHTLDYTFTHAQPRDAEAFGLDTGGRMMLVPAARLRNVATALAEAYPQPS
ncbi:p21-C-terminal region-binding protein-domain-containing protein [Cerioporus squamosus]|nr:p21-C-terminal region-binding protein-domain-containing protein [Cerioporus squamosus]